MNLISKLLQILKWVIIEKMLKKTISWIGFTLSVVFISLTSEHILAAIYIEEINQTPLFNILFDILFVLFWFSIVLLIILWFFYTIKKLYVITLYIQKLKIDNNHKNTKGLLRLFVLIPISKSVVEFLKKASEFSETPLGKGLGYMFGVMGFFLGIISLALALFNLT